MLHAESQKLRQKQFLRFSIFHIELAYIHVFNIHSVYLDKTYFLLIFFWIFVVVHLNQFVIKPIALLESLLCIFKEIGQ